MGIVEWSIETGVLHQVLNAELLIFGNVDGWMDDGIGWRHGQRRAEGRRLVEEEVWSEL